MVRLSSRLECVLFLLLAGLPGVCLEGQEPILTPDVHFVASTIQAEIEAIRWHTGRPSETRPPLPVIDVSIRENFGQAMSLWDKVNQLGVELVGGGEAPPIVRLPRDGAYGPSEVHQVLTSVVARVAEIREGLGNVGAVALENRALEPMLDPTADPTDVFEVIVQTNRQVNRMLERPIQPGDVYQQVQQAVFYASEILTASGDANAFPAPPDYEPGLQPGHVYGRLLLVFDRLAVAFDALGLDMVRWSGGAYETDPSLSPSDVYDIASLLLSELEYLHALVPGTRVPLLAPHPGLRWPSDVYQQAGILSEQATYLIGQARTNPDMVVNPGTR